MEPNRVRRNQMRRPQNTRTISNECGCSNMTVSENMEQYALAMAYVPWQKFGETYDLEKGFMTGTIFPVLNKPFMKERCCKS